MILSDCDTILTRITMPIVAYTIDIITDSSINNTTKSMIN